MDGAYEDLRVWVNDVLRPYRLYVNDFGSSWRSGLEILLLFIVLFFFKIKTILTYAALAAIIHHIRPTLLDIDSLDERNGAANLTAAFKAAEALGVPQLIDLEDILSSHPDQHAVATYILELFNAAHGQKDVSDEANMAWDEEDEVDVVRNTSEMIDELFRQNSGTSGSQLLSPRARKASEQSSLPLSPRNAASNSISNSSQHGPLSPRKASDHQPQPLSPRKGSEQRPLSPRKATDTVVKELLDWTTVLRTPFVSTPDPASALSPRSSEDSDPRALPPLPPATANARRDPGSRDLEKAPPKSKGSSLPIGDAPQRPAPKAIDQAPQRPEERSVSPSKRGVAFNNRPAIAHAWTPAPEIKPITTPKSALRKVPSPESTRVRRRSDAVIDEAPVVDPYTGEVVPRTGAILEESSSNASLATFIDLRDVTRTSTQTQHRESDAETPARETIMSSAHLRRPSVCGLLYKQDPEGNLIQGWKKRWFYLKGGRLFYYKEDEDTPISFISLRTVLAITMAEGKKNTLTIVTPKRPYNLKASSRDEMMHWLQELRVAKQNADALEAKADHKFAKEGPVVQCVGRTLKKRYAYIHGGFICVLESASNREKKLKLPLLGSRIVALSEEQTGVKGAFEVRSDDNRVALLAADSPLETDDWIMCLKQAKVIVEAQIKNVRSMRKALR